VVLPLAACMLPPPNGALAPSPTVEVKDDQFSSAVPLSAARVSDASHYMSNRNRARPIWPTLASTRPPCIATAVLSCARSARTSGSAPHETDPRR